MVRAGLDVGATHLRAAVGTVEELAGHASQETPTGDTQLLLDSLRETLEAACRAASVDITEIDQTGIGSLGPLDDETGAIVEPPNLDGIDRVPLVDSVTEWTDGSVSLYNDATAGALGSVVASPARPDNLVYVTISTGLGAGAVVDGHLLRGQRGNAAEVGHITLDPESALPCGCGGTGHWEAFCAGSNIPAFARHLAAAHGVQTNLDLDSLTAKAVFEHDGDDALATRTVEAVGRYNALGVAAVVHAYDPEVVVLGGAVALNNPEAICDPIRDRLPELVVDTAPTVRVTELGDEAVVLGALAGAVPTPLASHYGET